MNRVKRNTLIRFAQVGLARNIIALSPFLLSNGEFSSAIVVDKSETDCFGLRWPVGGYGIRAVTKVFPQLASRAGKMEKLPARIETYQPKHYIRVTAL